MTNSETYTTIAQYPEKNFSSRDIDALSGEGLLVRSIWYTLQGEGPFAGQPATFIRLAGCNRGAKTDSCNFCDTDFLVSSSTVMAVESIIAKVAELAGSTRLVVLTGGEPFMHGRTNLLVSTLIQAGYRVQVESNGDFVRADSAPGAIIVVSPKLSLRTGRYARPNSGMLERADYLKVLVSADESSPYHYLPDYLHDFIAEHGTSSVFVSPINEYQRPVAPGEIASIWGDMYDRVKCGLNHSYAASLALKHSFKLSLQLHAFVSLP